MLTIDGDITHGVGVMDTGFTECAEGHPIFLLDLPEVGHIADFHRLTIDMIADIREDA
jgi:hypothetical protein